MSLLTDDIMIAYIDNPRESESTGKWLELIISPPGILGYIQNKLHFSTPATVNVI